MSVTDEMVDRFLCWKFPDDFNPDGGVSFVKPNHHTSWPVGTNLFTATQARRMLEHVLETKHPSHEPGCVCVHCQT